MCDGYIAFILASRLCTQCVWCYPFWFAECTLLVMYSSVTANWDTFSHCLVSEFSFLYVVLFTQVFLAMRREQICSFSLVVGVDSCPLQHQNWLRKCSRRCHCFLLSICQFVERVESPLCCMGWIGLGITVCNLSCRSEEERMFLAVGIHLIVLKIMEAKSLSRGNRKSLVDCAWISLGCPICLEIWHVCFFLFTAVQRRL